MSTSTTSSNRFSLVENWDTETLIIFLRDLDINLDEDDFKILRKQKIDGQTFPDMTEKKFMKDGIKRGPAMKLEKQAKILKEKTRALEKGKIEYFWLFPCGVWSIQHFVSWSTNIFGSTERNEAHTIFTICYIFSMMIQIPLRRSSRLLEISYLRKRYVFSILQAQTRIFQI